MSLISGIHTHTHTPTLAACLPSSDDRQGRALCAVGDAGGDGDRSALKATDSTPAVATARRRRRPATTGGRRAGRGLRRRPGTPRRERKKIMPPAPEAGQAVLRP